MSPRPFMSGSNPFHDPPPAPPAEAAPEAAPVVSPWLPFTPRGTAAFARARLGRLLFVQLLFALAAGVVVAWFLQRAWFPVMDQAVPRLPVSGEISGGQLRLDDSAPLVLGTGHFLSLALQPEGQPDSDAAELQVVLGAREVRLRSLLGWTTFPYPPQMAVHLNRAELVPKCAAAGTVAALMISWAVLALIYSAPARLVAALASREAGWCDCFRLCAAALLPAAALLTLCIVLHGLSLLDTLQLALVFALHFIAGWIQTALALARLPRRIAPVENPFNKPGATGKPGAARSPKNPFH
jgi:hypothetical protein